MCLTTGRELEKIAKQEEEERELLQREKLEREQVRRRKFEEQLKGLMKIKEQTEGIKIQNVTYIMLMVWIYSLYPVCEMSFGDALSGQRMNYINILYIICT